jgi:hypothetical protein
MMVSGVIVSEGSLKAEAVFMRGNRHVECPPTDKWSINDEKGRKSLHLGHKDWLQNGN